MVTFDGGRVSTADAVAVTAGPNGAQLREAYAASVRALTFGLVRMRGNSLALGPVELLRFGRPEVTDSSIDWPIEGGLLSGERGGRWRLEASGGRVEASLSGWRPRLPLPIYRLTHLHVHQLFTRLYLLRLRGRKPSPGAPATRDARLHAAMVDVALCLTLAGFTGRRRPMRIIAIAAAYHVASWSLSGSTLGGLVLRQRVVAVDGSRLTATQALFRLALLPMSWLVRRPIHDELAATEVIRD